MLTSGLAFAQKPEALREANLGVTLAQQAKYPEAVQAYQRAIAIDSSLPGIYLNLGLAWFKLGKFKEALAAFEKEQSPAAADRVQALMAMSYFGQGMYLQAADHLKPLAAAQPENNEIQYLLAKAYLGSGQYNAALAMFQEMLKRDQNSAVVHMLLGEALDANSRTADAAAEYEAASKAAPDTPEVHFGLGYLYWKLRRFDEAATEFREELKRNAKHAQATAYLGDALMKSEHHQGALPILKQAARLEPDQSITHLDLGLLDEEAKNSTAAINEFQRAVALDPGGYEAHYRLARLYKQMGRNGDAAKEFEVVQRLHKKSDEEPLIKMRAPAM